MSGRTQTQINLQYPVEIDGAKVSVLHLRRPKVRDLIAASKAGGVDPVQREVRLFSNLCEITPETVEELDIADYTKIQEAYGDFSSGSMTEGK
jgi:hypothetical protein